MGCWVQACTDEHPHMCGTVRGQRSAHLLFHRVLTADAEVEVEVEG